MSRFTLHIGDAAAVLATLPSDSVDCIVTSPPYWGLRDYGVAGQIGLEPTVAEFLARLVAVFDQVRRVLKPTGTCWVNMGDSWVTAANTGTGWNCPRNGLGSAIEAGKASRARRRTLASTGLRRKNLIGQPWRLAFALQDAGWFLRAEVIWHKPNPQPETVRDRPARCHESIFLLTKKAKYFYNADAVREPVTGNAKSRGNGISRKVTAVAGWQHGPGSHSPVDHNQGDRKTWGQRGERMIAGKQNPNWSLAHTGILDTGLRNCRSVWVIPTQPYHGAHFATFPERLVERCMLAGCPGGGVMCDPFAGSGTVGVVALRSGRSFVGIELSPKYAELATDRLARAEAAGVQSILPLTGRLRAQGAA